MKVCPPIDPETARRVRIAVNCRVDLPRDTVCRAGARPEIWLDTQRASADLAHRLGITLRQLERVLESTGSIGATADAEIEKARRLGLRVLTLEEADYPSALHQLELPPPVIYLHGSLPQGPAIAVVGSRSANAIGRETAELFGAGLGAAGICVVSGMARGIDTWAHRSCLDAGGVSVAILGSGLDRIHPRHNVALAADLARRGAVISEFPLGCSPLPRNFPIRNRIIAVLASACLVIQATRRSGSLITARLALELGRDIYAVPGGIFDRLSEGTNLLIRDGAYPALHPDDLLETGSGLEEAAALPVQDDPLLRSMKTGELLPAEALAARMAAPIADVLVRLAELEIEGRVRRRAGGLFTLRR